MKYVIDGLFLTQQITGIQRYAFEITNELDKLVDPNEIEILVPEKAEIGVNFKNIECISYGKHNGILWQQTDFLKYARKNKRLTICLTNILPLLYAKGIVVIHDVSYKANPQFFTSKRDRLSALWHRLNYWRVAHSKAKIVTVSNFSKSEICKYYNVSPKRISVIYDAWQHMDNVVASADTFVRFPQLREYEYFFSMCTLAPNKNLKWIINCAKQNPELVFAIAGGGKMKDIVESDYGNLENIHFLGYVTDEDAKTLMSNCKAFIFPTLYEGFGIPPLESIACGAKSVFVSDTPCMREIYGDFANYIDLTVDNCSLQQFDSVHNYSKLLEKYSWKQSAQNLFDLMHSGR